MCTVTWRREPGGFELLFNRDESRTRGPELAPTAFEVGGLRALAPTDSDCGGTWICVNELGFATCVLNGYAESPDGLPAVGVPLGGVPLGGAPLESRGNLVRALAGSESIRSATRRLDALDLDVYASFELVLLEPDAPAATYAWDGAGRARELSADQRAPLASSGVDQAEARRLRREDFERRTALAGVTREALLGFHASHANGPSATSTCMHRPDARTRSMTRILVTPRAVSMHHTPGPPCRTEESPPLTLARRGLARRALPPPTLRTGEPG